MAEVDGRLATTVLVGHDGRRGYTHHLAAAYQRLGCTRQLTDHALSALAGDGIGKCHFFAFTDNAPARAFWSGLGAEERATLGLWPLSTG